MPDSPLLQQVARLRDLAAASPAVREDATRLADALEREVSSNRQAAAGEAFQALQGQIQPGSTASQSAQLGALQQQLAAQYEVFTPAATDADVEAEIQGANTGAFGSVLGGGLNLARDYIPGVSGFQDATMDFGLRTLGGAARITEDAGLGVRDEAALQIPEVRAKLGQSMQRSPGGTLAGGVLPFLGAGALGPAGLGVLGATEGASTYGEGREMGLDPGAAAVRGGMRGGALVAGMRIAPATRFVAGKNAMLPAGQHLLRKELGGAAASTVDAIPQTMMMTGLGAGGDVVQGDLRGDPIQKQQGIDELKAVPEHLPEMALMNPLLHGLHARGRIKAERIAEVRPAVEKGLLLDARQMIEGQRIRENQEGLEADLRVKDRILPPGIAEQGVELMGSHLAGGVRPALARAPQAAPVEGAAPRADLPDIAGRMGRRGAQADLRQQMGLPPLDAGLAPMPAPGPEGVPYTPVDRAIMAPDQAAVEADYQQRAAASGWTPREQATDAGVRGRQAQLAPEARARRDAIYAAEQTGDPVPPPLHVPQRQQVPGEAGPRVTRIDNSSESVYARAVESVGASKDISTLRTKAAAASKALGLDPAGARQLELDAAAAWRARRDAAQPLPAPKGPDAPSPAAPAVPAPTAAAGPAPVGRAAGSPGGSLPVPGVRPSGPAGAVPAPGPVAPAGGPGGVGHAAPGTAGTVAPGVKPPTREPATVLGGYLGNKVTMWTRAKDMAGKVGNAFAKPIDMLKGATQRIVEPFGGSGVHGAFFKRAMPGVPREINDLSPIVHEIHRLAKNDPAELTRQVNGVADAWAAKAEELYQMAQAGASHADIKAATADFLTSLKDTVGGEVAKHAIGKTVKDWSDGTHIVAVDNIRKAATSVQAHAAELAGDTVTAKPTDAREMVAKAGKGDTLILDPPYIDTAGYAEGGDMSKDIAAAERFIREDIAAALGRGAHVIYTNAPHPVLLRALRDIGLHTDIVWVPTHGVRERTLHDPAHPDPNKNTLGARIGERPEVSAYSDPSRSYTPVAERGTGPVGAGREADAPRSVRPNQLSSEQHADAVADAQKIKGVTVEKDAEGNSVVRLKDVVKPIPLHPDIRPVEALNPRSWLTSALAKFSPAQIAGAVAEALRARNIKPPHWAIVTKGLTRQGLIDAWNDAAGSKPGKALQQAVMEDHRPTATVEINGKAVGFEATIQLGESYKGKGLQEETWHLGWHVLKDSEKADVLSKLSPERRKLAEKDENLAMEEGTEVLMRAWANTVQRGKPATGWLATKLRGMREGLAKILPFLTPKIDRVQKLAEEFGEGRAFKRIQDAQAAPATTIEAPSVTLKARRAQAEASDEQRTTWARQDREANEILQDGEKLDELFRAAKAQEPLSAAQAQALRVGTQESLNQALGLITKKSLDPALADYAAFAHLHMLANRKAGQELRALQNVQETNIQKILGPLTTPRGEWARKIREAGSPEQSEAILNEWKARNNLILDKLAERGIDLRDAGFQRDMDDMSADSVNLLRYEVDTEANNSMTWKGYLADLSAGRVVSDLTMRNLLWIGSAVSQVAGGAIYATRAGVRAGVESLSSGIKALDPEVVAGFGGRAQAAQHIISSLMTGTKLAIESVRTGNSVAKPRLTGHGMGEENLETMEYHSFIQDLARLSGKSLGSEKAGENVGAATRVAVGPGLEAVRFIDELTWATTYDLTRRMLAAKRADGRDVGDIIQDADIIDEAKGHADRVTQRMRPDKGTVYGKMFGAVEALRSPTFGGVLAKGPYRWLYNPLFHIMPIFRSVAILTGDAAKIAAAPVRGLQGGATLLTLRDPGKLAAYAEGKGISPEAARRALTNRFFDQMTDAALGALGMAIVGLIDDDLLPAPRGGSEGRSEAKVRDLAKPQGTFAGTSLARLSPVYESTQYFATARDMIKGKASAEQAATGLGRAILERPLLGGVKALFNPQTDPSTGESLSTTQAVIRQIARQVGGIGSAHASTMRAMTEDTQRRAADPSEFMLPMGNKRIEAKGLTGETRSVPKGIITRGLFGSLPTGGANEVRLAKLLVKLNDAADSELNADRPAGARAKSGSGGWWPGMLNQDLVSPEDRRFVERLPVEQQERLNELTGKAWFTALQPHMDRLEKLGDKDAAAALKAMKAIRERAAKGAKMRIAAELR